MKRPLQLPLAITLALCGTDALALGLGPVHVKSRLNQPLEAEIPVLQGTAGEAEGLLVNLAGAEDFERIGLSRSRLGVPLEFSVVKGAHGEFVIKVTSKEPVREPYLDFLVEANWPKGRLLREYTLLLDPPLTAPARQTAQAPAAPLSPGTVTLTKREKPARAPAATAVAPAPTPRAKPAPAPAPEQKVAGGEYGPVEAGETLSAVARAARGDEHVNLNQMMLALLKNNPNAFYKDNINALKRGAILRIPSAEEIKAVGSASDAATQVRAQVEDWRGGRASPTLVADSGTPAAAPAQATGKPAKTAKAGAEPSERLELVPPKAGKDSLATADHAGSAAGSAAKGAAVELKSELARTKEALTAREQESGELRSRVKELEDIKGKNDRLISLKDSEIAELQQKLKQLQEKSPASAAKPAAAPTSATPVAQTPPAAAAPAPAATTTPATTPAPVAATAKPAPAAGEGAKIDKQDIWGDAGKGGKPAEPAKAPAADATAHTAPGATVTPLPPTPPTSSSTPTTPAATPAQTASNPPPAATPAPAAATPPAPAKTAATPPKPVVKPAPAPAAPWYEEGWVKSAALAAGIVLLLGGLVGLRKRKPKAAAAAAAAGSRGGSIADAFGDSPLSGADGAEAGDGEEAKLREQLRRDPSNVGLHLELLSLLYAERSVAKFEEQAAEMRHYVTDVHQPEWLEAQSMGQELAPHNPLFADAAHYDDGDAMSATAHADTVERPVLDRHDDFISAFDDLPSHTPTPPPEPAHAPAFAASDFPFGVEPQPAKAAADTRDGFDFDDLPPLDFDLPQAPPPVASTPAPVYAPAAAAMLDDLPPAPPAAARDDVFGDDDAVGTKLDLAKAYMDMGDPEGARSMLEEVIAEGTEAQKSEAHRLIADIR
jgi:pilus assembly protein FimV